MEYGISKIRLRDHYLIFVDSGEDEHEKKRFALISAALRNIGARTATHRSFTLKRGEAKTLDEVVSSIGLLLDLADSVWVVYQDNDKVPTVVVSRADDSPDESVTTTAS